MWWLALLLFHISTEGHGQAMKNGLQDIFGFKWEMQYSPAKSQSARVKDSGPRSDEQYVPCQVAPLSALLLLL